MAGLVKKGKRNAMAGRRGAAGAVGKFSGEKGLDEAEAAKSARGSKAGVKKKGRK